MLKSIGKIWHKTFCPWGIFGGDGLWNWKYKFCIWLNKNKE